MKKPQLVIMAAGIGSRYGGLKQIDPVGSNGEIIIDYSIYDALEAGFDKIIFIIRKSFEKDFKEIIGNNIEKRVECAYVFQEPDTYTGDFSVPLQRNKPWGTGHALLCAENYVDAPFALINADDYYGAHAFSILFNELSNKEDYESGMLNFSMVGYILKQTLTEHGHVARGICTLDSDSFLTDIVERTNIQKMKELAFFIDENGEKNPLSPESIVSMNMWGFTPGIFSELKTRFKEFLTNQGAQPKSEFFIPSVISELIHEKKALVKVMNTREKWLGVTYREDMPPVRQAIHDMIQRGIYPERLWEK